MSNRTADLLAFLSESPNDPFLKYALTMEYKKMGEDQLVRAGFEDLIQNHGDYIGTYYHYAKFLELAGEKDKALQIYQIGMEVAQRLKNRHAYGELQSAYKLAMGLDEDDWEDD